MNKGQSVSYWYSRCRRFSSTMKALSVALKIQSKSSLWCVLMYFNAKRNLYIESLSLITTTFETFVSGERTLENFILTGKVFFLTWLIAEKDYLVAPLPPSVHDVRSLTVDSIVVSENHAQNSDFAVQILSQISIIGYGDFGVICSAFFLD